MAKKKKKNVLWEKLKVKKNYITYAIQFVFTILVYGLLIAFMLSTLTSLEFDMKTVVATGIAFYFIKEELPRIINKSLPKPPSFKVM